MCPQATGRQAVAVYRRPCIPDTPDAAAPEVY